MRKRHYGKRPCPSCGERITTNALGRYAHKCKPVVVVADCGAENGPVVCFRPAGHDGEHMARNAAGERVRWL